MRAYSLFLAAVILQPAIGLAAEAERYPRADLLLEPAELAVPALAGQFVILDVRSAADYDESHIPGALRVDHGEWKAAFGTGRDADAWSKLIGNLGITDSSKVVIYDNKDMKDAARIWWILSYWSAPDVRLLDGGWKTWAAEGYPTTDRAGKPPTPAKFKAVARRRKLANMKQILAQLDIGQLQIIDVRSEGEFCGVDAKNNKRAGAIPGAKNLEWSNMIDLETGRFKPADELRRLFDTAGIDIGGPSASHCETGGRASVMVFALELMGAKKARNYYPGWSEWGNADDTPVAAAEVDK